MRLFLSLASALLVLLAFANAAAVQPASPLMITEIYYDTPGSDAEEEWIEIANVGTAVFSLENVKLGDAQRAGSSEGMVRFPEGTTIEAGEVIVVAQTAVSFTRFYGFPPDYELQESDPDVLNMRRFLLWADGDLALNNGGDEVLLLDEQNRLLDGVSYGESETQFAPSVPLVATGQSIARLPANCDSDSAADWQPQPQPAPGQISLDAACAVVPTPTPLPALPPIGTIQGVGDISPLLGQTVSFRGIVTGVYQDQNAAGTIFYTAFVQDVPGSEDGDPLTSDGTAVFTGRRSPDFGVGDLVRVTGQVTEFFGFTEIDDAGLEVVVEATNQPLPPPVPLALPQDLEPLEGMRVAIDGDARVVGPTYGGCGLAVVPSAEAERPLRHASDDVVPPVITVLHQSDVRCGTFPNVKTDDLLAGIVGPLIYNFDEFKIVQQVANPLTVTVAVTPTLPAPLVATEGQLTIASFNLWNHFDEVDDTGDDAEPKPTAEEIAIKQQKLAYALGVTLGCPTLVGVQEVENETLLLALASATADFCGFTYEVTHHESVDVRGIDVALLSDPRRVRVTHSELRQGCTPIETGIVDAGAGCENGRSPLFSRPPLQVNLLVDDVPYRLLVNHFKSKRGGEAETAPRRVAQAQHVATLVDSWRLDDPEARIVVLGDFNDFDRSAAMNVLGGNGRLHNLLQTLPAESRYSFVFGGVAQLIDAILVSPALLGEVAEVSILHVNADFPVSLADDVSPAALPYRATDHDLPLLLLNLPQAEPEPTPTAVPTATVAVVEEVEDGENGRLGWLGLGLLGVGGLGIGWRRRSAGTG